MTSVRFLRGDRAGTRWYAAGEMAGIPDADARRLAARGAVEILTKQPAAEAEPAALATATPVVEQRTTKPSGKFWRR